MTSCVKCGRRWKSCREVHCAVCHEHFSAYSGFDEHKYPIGVGGCKDPADTALVLDENRQLWKGRIDESRLSALRTSNPQPLSPPEPYPSEGSDIPSTHSAAQPSEETP